MIRHSKYFPKHSSLGAPFSFELSHLKFFFKDSKVSNALYNITQQHRKGLLKSFRLNGHTGFVPDSNVVQYNRLPRGSTGQ